MKRVYSDEGLSPTLTDMQGGNRQPKIIASTQAHAAISDDGISPTLTTAMGIGGGQVPMILEDSIPIKNATKQGYQEAYEGDSVNLAYPESKTRHGRVGNQVAQTLQCNDSMRVVTEELEHQELIEDEIRDNINDMLWRRGLQKEEKVMTLKSKDKRLKKLVDNTEFIEGEVMSLDTHNQTTHKDISQCLIDQGHNKQKLYDGLRIRKLTPKECWRLMGFHDDEFERASKVCSNSQLYKQAGNSIVVNVLEEIFKNLFMEL
jgi:DNA (cytosine-5)-methyltransferase 1